MISIDRPWLSFDLQGPCQVLSWALNRPGRVIADQIVWREVRNSELTEGMDVQGWLQRELVARRSPYAVAFLTSRNVEKVVQVKASVQDVTACAVATVGLSNAERVGARVDYGDRDWGTINLAVQVNQGLTEAALIEAMSIATQARTAAVIEADFTLPTGRATGTGTDCVAVAAPDGTAQYAGLHTDIGEAIGRAAFDAIYQGACAWIAEDGGSGRAKLPASAWVTL